MRLSWYFFRQYIPSFIFGVVLFAFVFLIDKLFDLIDLILNKGVDAATVGELFALFLPTAFPLAFPMAILLACMVTFGRLSEENELTAVRAAGISLAKALWMIPLFALLLCFSLIPFNTQVAPWINRAFRLKYQQIIHSDPLINITVKKFFSIKNIKIFAHGVDTKTNRLFDLFVYQLPKGGRPAERIFARSGHVNATKENFKMTLKAGQLQRFDPFVPHKLIHATFGEYIINIPLKLESKFRSTRFRNIPTKKLKAMVRTNKQKGFKTASMEAELSLRYALAFAPLCLVLIGIPLATTLKKGGRAFNIGMSLVIIFTYYLILVFGLTLAEKGVLPALPSLWMANVLCMSLGIYLIRRLMKK